MIGDDDDDGPGEHGHGRSIGGSTGTIHPRESKGAIKHAVESLLHEPKAQKKDGGDVKN